MDALHDADCCGQLSEWYVLILLGTPAHIMQVQIKRQKGDKCDFSYFDLVVGMTVGHKKKLHIMVSY